MFSCCVRHFRPQRQDQTAADNDCRWKTTTGPERKGNRRRGNPRGDTGTLSSDSDCPGGLRPPIFYLDSGDSTDTDAPTRASVLIRQSSRNNSGSDAAAVINGAMTSHSRLDPNSQLQRKSKLHNEKLPIFSALDRTKRPRARRKGEGEDSGAVYVGVAMAAGGGCGGGASPVLVYEPLTFETFRSSSPPLAVIAPLSKPAPSLHRHGHNNGHVAKAGREVSSLQKPHSDAHGNTPGRTETTCSRTDDAERRRSIPSKDNNNLPEGGRRTTVINNKLVGRHQSSVSSKDRVRFQGKGRVNEGYSSGEEEEEEEEEEVVVVADTSPCKVPSSRASDVPLTDSPALHGGKTGGRRAQNRRPTTLQLPPLPDAGSSFSSRNSASTLPNETSYTGGEDSAVDTDAISLQAQNPNGSRSGQGGDSDNPESHLRQHTNSPPKPSSLDNSRLVGKSIENTHGARDDLTPENVSTGRKKIPPKKPKRRNPPSNVSSVASCKAIESCLASKEAVEPRGVSSSESERHSDVDTRNASCDKARPEKGLLTPPHSFLDHVYAGFDSFDEVNGSLV